jgi:AcrR family transcriptional regulator
LDVQTILNAGIELAKTRGYRGVYKRHLAEVLGCGMGTINYHWGTMNELRAAIVRRAIAIGNRQIVTQAVALGDPVISRENLSQGQREKLDKMRIRIS